MVIFNYLLTFIVVYLLCYSLTTIAMVIGLGILYDKAKSVGDDCLSEAFESFVVNSINCCPCSSYVMITILFPFILLKGLFKTKKQLFTENNDTD